MNVARVFPILLSIIWTLFPVTASAQDPAARGSGSTALLSDFKVACRALEASNVKRADVYEAIELPAGPDRTARLIALANGYPHRLGLLVKAANASDESKASGRGTIRAAAACARLCDEIYDLNISAARVQYLLKNPSPEHHRLLEEMQMSAADYPARLQALNNCLRAWDRYVKAAPDTPKASPPAGVQFHILLEGPELDSAAAKAMVSRLKRSGPSPHARDRMRWFEVSQLADAEGVNVQTYGGADWVLAWAVPGKQVLCGPVAAHPTKSDTMVRSLGLRFNERDADELTQLTERHTDRKLALVIHDQVLFIATVQSVIAQEAMITSTEGYSLDDIEYLLEAISASPAP